MLLFLTGSRFVLAGRHIIAADDTFVVESIQFCPKTLRMAVAYAIGTVLYYEFAKADADVEIQACSSAPHASL